MTPSQKSHKVLITLLFSISFAPLQIVGFSSCLAETSQPTLPKASYISPEILKNWMEEKQSLILVDVRHPKEYKKGHIAGAINIPYNKIEKYARKWDKDARIVFYCIHSSWRAPYAANVLADRGFKNSFILEGGIAAWKGGGQTIKASSAKETPGVAPYPDGLKIVLKHPADKKYNQNFNLTLDELTMFDGQKGRPAFVAVDGVIYDLTQSRLWRGGAHDPGHNEVFAGRDLTEKIKDSPHGAKELQKFPVVGQLVERRIE